MIIPLAGEATLLDDLHELLLQCVAAQTSVTSLSCRWKSLAESVAQRAKQARAPRPSDDIVGDPAILAPIAYHAECLSTIGWRGVSETAVPQKVCYHLRMLGHALSPVDERFLPLVSIVVQGDDPAPLTLAIQSALSQSYAAVELIVVNRSPKELPATSVRETVPVTIAHMPGIDIGAARNAGMERTSGDFIHFLDGGQELLPDAIARKVAAFSEICDARLCFTPLASNGNDATVRIDLEEHRVEVLDRLFSATDDALLTACRDASVGAGSIMTPRWFAELVGAFETDLGSAADGRYFLRMARHGLKAIAVRKPGFRRSALSALPVSLELPQIEQAIAADLRSAVEFGERPRAYRYLVPLLSRATRAFNEAFRRGLSQERLDVLHEQFLDLESRLGKEVPSAAGLTAILCDQLLFMIRQARRRLGEDCEPMRCYLAEREDQLLERLQAEGSVSTADLRRWLPDLPPRPFHALTTGQRAGLKFALEQLQVAVLLGELVLPFRSLVRVGADYPGHPYENFWNGLARLARVLGDENAKRICRQKFFRSGWQWLGQARRMFQPQEVAA